MTEFLRSSWQYSAGSSWGEFPGFCRRHWSSVELLVFCGAIHKDGSAPLVVLLAKHVLLKKASLEHTSGHDTDARRTIERIKSIPGSDRLVNPKWSLLKER